MQRAGSGKDDSQQRTPSASQPQAISQLILGHAVQTGAASTQPTNTTLLAPLHSVPAPSPSVAAPMLAPSFTLTAPVPRGLAGVAPYYASATPTGVGILSKPPPNCFITASPTSITRARVQPGLTGGLVAVPPVGQTRKPQHPSPQSSSPRPVPHSLLVVQQVAAPELQMARPQAGGMASLAPLTSASATGGTIHHLGHSPPRGGMPPLANPTMVPHMSSGQPNPPFIQMSPGVLPRRDSTSATGSPSVPGLVSLQYPIIKSPVQSPERPRKKVKVEEKPPATPEIGTWRKVVQEQKIKELRELKENYNEHLTELFFLQNGGNIMDYYTWKKRPTVQLVQFLKSGNLDSDDEDIPQEKKINDEVKVLMTSGGTTPLATPIAISTTLPAAITAMQQQGIDQSRKPGGRHGMVFAHAPPQMSVSQAPASQPSTPVGTPTTGRPTVAQILKSASSSSSNVAASTTLHAHLTEATVTPTTAAQKTPVVSSAAGTVKTLKTPTSSQKSPRPGAGSALDSTIGSQEAIVERAKQEAQVMQRIAELRKNGMWSARRLPKVQEPPRNKAHWDYLLEEMQWLAADFAQERKWKKAGARKIARMISKHFQEQQQKELRAEKEEVMKLKRIASQMARQIKEFWQNIEKVVQFKQQSRLEEKKKRALDLHLSFIVDQTEKYSSWLTEGLGTRSTTSSVYSGSQATSPAPDADQEDGDFEPVKDESDDEETIEKEEQETDLNEESTRNEIDALQRESEMPIEELLQSLPPEVLEKPAPLDLPEEDDGQEAGDEDEEFRSSDEEAEDDEETLEEEEKQERTVDHSQEISELQQEGEMPMEELLQKYAGAYDSDFEAELSAQSTETEEDSDDIPTDYEDEEDEEADDEEEEIDVEGEDDVGMECLFDTEKQKKGDGSEPGHEITDIAAAAQSLQPTGYTLETTQVKTPVPFLLKHTLREYQHVGLDWLATMYDRRLNGILADEMGLGKTIQTIALLAHLACEKGVWGPHLIVVPTSVMLNWEMEIKKWCPAFKILTYYGTQKERKQKRQGWTKTNAFHVCITSYKLVIQDHQSFRRKKWKYFILDEAQNIKNFKSQRWQTLLNFSSQRRLLLTGTPLQNNLMELWSLMHFLMPHVFQSHREFKEWFSNPLSGMIEGSREYNESLIRRLHKVLRPFLLRRLKHDVEKQLPKKYEHVVMCRLSKRQRFLYDDFMSQAKTKETLATGHFMSVINILMQLRKVCNHPNLFDPRPTVSPFQMEGITYSTASAVLRALEKDPVEYIDPSSLYPCLADLELKLPAFAAHRIRKLQTPKPLIEEIDSTPEPPPRPEPLKKPLSVVFRNLSSALQSTELSNQQQTGRGSPLVETGRMSPAVLTKSSTPVPTFRSTASTPSTPQISTQQPKTPAASSIVTSAVLSRALSTPVQVTTPAPSAVTGTPIEQLPGYKPTIQSKLQVQQRAATVTQVTTTPVTATPVSSVAQQMISSQPITLHLQQTEQGTRLLIPSGQLAQLPAGLLSIVQTPGGQQIITTQPVSQSQAQVSRPIVNGPVPVSRPPITTTASSTAVVMTTTAATVQVAPSVSRTPQAVQLPTSAITVAPSKPVMRVAPLTTTTASASCQLSSALSTSAVGSSPLSSSHTSTASVHASTPTGHVTRSRTKLEKSLEPEKKSPFFLQSLEDKRRDWREECLRRLIYLNKRNCDIRPVYGQDLCGAVDILKQKMPSHHTGLWKGQGYIHCCIAQRPALFNPNLSHHYWTQTRGLVDMVHTPEELLASMKDILDRFQFVTPAVTAPRTCLHASHPPPEHLSHQRVLEYMLHKEVSPKAACLHRISTNMSVQFPELRLIQYDCGKLQTLDILLRRLKSGQHRVLIFTQMTKMLDVMEQFLSFHGYRYLRLDGTTRVEQRQALMDRFNMDKRIFVFILSTRSGGIGVNLTGADTVIFYDSDWNPTMDAQAQDRCHRIGQTRDVHIYRLISEKTIEENILKKANQKRLLGNVAIEGGNFTTAFFKEQTIQELFEEPSGLEALAKEKEREELAKQVKEIKEKPVSTRSKRRSPTPAEPGKLTEEQMELALCNAEDETDVQAARVARAEQKAELAEFDEDIPWDEREEQQRKEREEEMSKVEQELLMLEKELTPVERYAVCYMESVLEPECTEELELAEKEVEIAKEEWELGRLKALKEEEERRAAFEEDEMLFTYTRDDAYNQIFVCDETGEHMPLWAPPTPPQDDNDLYIDQTVHFMYDPSVMTESQLPPVYIKKEHKKIKIENVRKHKGRKDEQVRVPRSLFDRPSAALVKLRREAKLAKMNKGIFRAPTGLKLPTVPNTLESSSDQADWFIHEDWALLQAVQMLMDVPLNLMIISPAHIPNWDLVADVVNGVSRVYRSAKQCKNRYESVIIPREEGRILYDINPRKQKKNKGIYKTKNNRPMKTSQINLQDNNHHVTNLFTLRFDSVKSLASRRSPTLRPTLANPSSKNPKHVAVLTDSGITYDQPMTPIQVAKIRAERIAREKKQNQQAVAEQRAAQLAQQQQQQQAGAQTVVTVAGSTAIAGVTTAMQGTATTILTGGLPKASLTGGATAVSIPRTLSPGSIVVNTASPVVSAALTQAIRTTRTAAGQEITAVVANPVTAQTPGRVTTVSGAQVITTTFNTAQLLAAQRAVSSGTTTTVAGQTLGIKTTGAVQQQLMQAKSLTPHQLSMFKTQQILKRQQTQQIQQARLATLTPAQAEQLKQQQQLKRLQAQGASVVGTVQKTVAVTTPLLTSVSQAATVAQTARLQAAKGTTLKHTTVARQMTREDMAALIKQQTALQHKTGSTQIFAQAQVQAVQQGTSSTPQVATLVKTVSTPGSVPSVTIPVSAVSVSGMNVSISLPQQKTTTGKMTTGTTQVRHQLQLQQLAQQRKSALHQQKVATLTQSQVQQLSKSQLGTQLGAVQIIPQQPKLTPTMIQQLVKQQTGSGQTAPTIQQIITSVTQAASSTATVITTPIVTQAASPSHKVSLPAGIVTTSLGQASRTGSVIGVTNVATSAANTTVTSTGTTQTVTVTIANSPVTNASGVTHGQTLMKPIQELVVSPAKALPTSSAVAQHLKTVSRPAQMVTISQGHQVQVKGSTMSVQQVVQQVQAQAQAQQAAQQRITTIPVTAAAASASPSVTVTQAAVSQSAQSTPQSVTQVSISTTTAQGTPQQQQAHAQAQARGTPYSMRLRNK